jgi:hypothetical protein
VEKRGEDEISYFRVEKTGTWTQPSEKEQHVQVIRGREKEGTKIDKGRFSRSDLCREEMFTISLN